MGWGWMGLDGMEWQWLERRARSGFGRTESAAIGVSAVERRCVNTLRSTHYYAVLVLLRSKY
jgi:hypothetical protein